MKRLVVHIEAHSFAGEELHDEYFDDAPGYAIAGPLIMAPLVPVRGKDFEIFYEKSSTLGDIEYKIERLIWDPSLFEEHLFFGVRFCFVSGLERYSVDNPNQNFEYIKDKYLDTDHLDRIEVCFLISHTAGAVEPKQGPLRYYMHSREKGKHHQPHVHVYVKGQGGEASVMILTGKVVGNIPPKYKKMASEQVLNNQRYYLECWNKLSDGLSVDINHALGLIGY